MDRVVLPYNDDKPHRCPACHVVTDTEHRCKRGIVKCCMCNSLFTKHWRFWRLLPYIGYVCTNEMDGHSRQFKERDHD